MIAKRIGMLYDFWRLNFKQRPQEFYNRFDEISKLMKYDGEELSLSQKLFGKALSHLVWSKNCGKAVKPNSVFG